MQNVPSLKQINASQTHLAAERNRTPKKAPFDPVDASAGASGGPENGSRR